MTAVNEFPNVPMAPPDSIFGIATAYKLDPSKDKINLSLGAYRDDDGKPYTFKVVDKVEK